MLEARRLACVAAAAALGACTMRPPAPVRPACAPCVPVATWVAPATRMPVAAATVTDAARRRRIVLLGERHDWAEDHRWQAHVLSILHAAHPRLVAGFEAFTPAADPALARWVAGTESFEAFLEDVDWEHAWGMPAALYRPLFETARLLGVELHGINVDRAVVRRVATEGFAALPAAERATLPPPRPPSAAYRARLAAAFAEHRCHPPAAADPAFDRFLAAQRTWDAVMAAALARLAEAAPDAIVVAIVGRGHVEHHGGIAEDLAARGLTPLVLLPWDATATCAALPADVADAVFGIAPLASEIPPEPPSPCADEAPTQRPR